MARQEGRDGRGRVAWLAAGLATLVVMVVYLAGKDDLWVRHGRVREGMTPGEVRSLLGDPGTPTTTPDGKESWYYHRSGWFSSEVFIVRFSAKGRVAEVDHDSFP